MSPRQLAYFCMIAECNSMSAAAMRLNVSQSALSLQMSALEDELQARLFDRRPRGVELTDQGRALLPRAREILALLEDARIEVQSGAIEPSGVVRLGMAPSMNNALASELLKQMDRAAPAVDVRLVCGPSQYLWDLLDDGRIDMCLAQSEGALASGYLVRPLLVEELYLVSGKGLARSCLGLTRKNASIEFQRLVDIKLLTTEGVDGLGALIRKVEAQQGIKLDTRPTLGQLMSDLRVIMDGEAAMILPWSAVHHLAEDPSLSVATISSPRLERRIDLISRDAFRNALAERRVAEVIGALVPHLLEKRLVKGRSLWQTSAGAHLSPE